MNAGATRGRVVPHRGVKHVGLGLVFVLVVALGAPQTARGDGAGAFRYSTSGDGRGYWIGVLPQWFRATRSGRPVIERRVPLRDVDLHENPVPSLHIECRAPPSGGVQANPEDPGRPFTAYLTARKWRQDRPARLWGHPGHWASLAFDWVFGGIEPAVEERAQVRVSTMNGGVEHAGWTTVRRLAHDWSAETRYVAVLDGAAVRAGLLAIQAAGEDLLSITVEGETIMFDAHYAFPPSALVHTLDAARACDPAPHL